MFAVRYYATMKPPRITSLFAWVTLLWLVAQLSVLPLRAGHFVHVTAEIKLTQWHSFHGKPNVCKVSCVVGTNGWQIDCEYPRGTRSTYWFMGARLVEINESPRTPTNQPLVN